MDSPGQPQVQLPTMQWGRSVLQAADAHVKVFHYSWGTGRAASLLPATQQLHAELLVAPGWTPEGPG